MGSAFFRQVLGHFATGVTVVTAVHADQPVGLTCQAFAALSLDPPLVLLAPSRVSTSWPRVEVAGTFCVNVLAETQQALARAFARTGGPKFAGVDWRPGTVGAPVLAGVTAWVECRLEAVHDGGDHMIVVGQVVDLGVGEGRPLLFYRGGYGRFQG